VDDEVAALLSEVEDSDVVADSEVEADSAAGGGVASVLLVASCFGEQPAVSRSAATRAPRANLVFIDRYPEEKQEW
jgi:hypothetical protein